MTTIKELEKKVRLEICQSTNIPMFQCGERFEIRHSIRKDGSKLNYPKCNAQNPKRIFLRFSVSSRPCRSKSRTFTKNFALDTK